MPIYDWTTALYTNETDNDSDKTITVPANQLWQPLTIWVELTTSADVGDRQLVIEILDPSDDIIAQVIPGATQAASINGRYLFALGAPDLSAVRNVTYLATPLPLLMLPAGYKIHIYDSAAIAAAADDLNIQMLYEWRSA